MQTPSTHHTHQNALYCFMRSECKLTWKPSCLKYFSEMKFALFIFPLTAPTSASKKTSASLSEHLVLKRAFVDVFTWLNRVCVAAVAQVCVGSLGSRCDCFRESIFYVCLVPLLQFSIVIKPNPVGKTCLFSDRQIDATYCCIQGKYTAVFVTDAYQKTLYKLSLVWLLSVIDLSDRSGPYSALYAAICTCHSPLLLLPSWSLWP